MKIRLKNVPRIRLIWPKVVFPKVRFKFPKIALPKTSFPKIRLPIIAILKPSWTGLRGGRLSAPKISLPKFSVPKASFPTITIPRLRLPRLPQILFTPPKFKAFKIQKVEMPGYIQQNANVLAGILICVALFTILQTGIGVDRNVFARSSEVLQKLATLDDQEQESSVETAQQDLGSILNSIIPASGEDASSNAEKDERYDFEDEILEVEAVLVPHENTVISSSRDGKIKAIHFNNGELFRKGDILVEYACKDLEAELEIARTQENLAKKKADASYKLFKLDIISDLEKMELETETQTAKARAELYQSRMEDCYIRADYDGRVVKRLANDSEFTRTDRVLMEVASLGVLRAEFLLPSRALRWVNINAPLEILVNETGKAYKASVKFIYGEVDPVSQSIQMTAQLEPYEDRLLPGMSGQATLDLAEIRKSGIYGFLEQSPEKGMNKRTQ